MAGSTVPVACTPVIRRITVIRTAEATGLHNCACNWSRCRCMITYHMRCPENGDTQRQAVEPGKPLCCVRAGMQIFTRASASNSTFLFHGGPSPRRSTRPPSLAPPASSPPGGGRRGGARRAVTRAEVASRARAASVELEFPFSREGIDEHNRM